MDADDISEPERFTAQLNALTETRVDIVGSHLDEFRDNPETPERTRSVPISHNKISEWMSWRCPVNHPTVTFEREAVLSAGGYRNFPMMEDWDLWLGVLLMDFDSRILIRRLFMLELMALPIAEED
jgi:hypothetical protein